ncbi:histidine phosphatase family protein [Lachancea thermotolerans CBS 6340]|uniref:acid phosphatase n=1 Tax=Lachancea thermotolerans (strain ATCC 56472 / CBS 6340 / NRRL Y-8284) TaxID=559295 RepID=C5DDE6_LACTC|nr:KLTH0C00396p [Lachancea thermotolerans CBS 6340]CAR21807.1 KLTH0C00396p [Lachancea thermotolerans CBS 6340]
MISQALVLLAASLTEAAPVLKQGKASTADVSKIGTQEKLFPYLAGSGPHYDYPLSYGIPKEIPEQCTLQQVQLFARHGERYPTQNKGKAIASTYKKLHDFNGTFTGALEFLNEDYEFFVQDTANYEELTTWDNILDPINPYVGELDAQKHARQFLFQYGELLENHTSFPIFTSNSKRVHDTANFFAKALGDRYNVSLQIIDEDPSMGANTLTPIESCTVYNESEQADVMNEYSDAYLVNLAGRLNTENSGLNLTKSDALNLFSWCAFEVNVKGYSNICDVFTADELVSFAYYDDMTSYYEDGPGNSLGSTVGGVNFNASVELLKQHEELDNKVWLSFTHDTNIVNYLSAIGLFDDGNKLPTDHVPIQNHVYHKSWMVPQGARVYTQLYQCGNSSYVRYVVNDVTIPIETCQSGPGFSCELNDFVDYASTRLEGQNYIENCKISSSSNQTSLTFYWDYTQKTYNASLIHS